MYASCVCCVCVGGDCVPTGWLPRSEKVCGDLHGRGLVSFVN